MVAPLFFLSVIFAMVFTDIFFISHFCPVFLCFFKQLQALVLGASGSASVRRCMDLLSTRSFTLVDV